jgi:hypothetical protein
MVVRDVLIRKISLSPYLRLKSICAQEDVSIREWFARSMRLTVATGRVPSLDLLERTENK